MCEVYLLSGYFSQNILSFWARFLRIIHCIDHYADHPLNGPLILYISILIDDEEKVHHIIANAEYFLYLIINISLYIYLYVTYLTL